MTIFISFRNSVSERNLRAMNKKMNQSFGEFRSQSEIGNQKKTSEVVR